MTVGSRSTNTALGTCLLASVSLKKVLNESSPPPIVLSLGIWPSGWMPCSRQQSSQQALLIWTPAWPTWMEMHSRMVATGQQAQATGVDTGPGYRPWQAKSRGKWRTHILILKTANQSKQTSMLQLWPIRISFAIIDPLSSSCSLPDPAPSILPGEHFHSLPSSTICNLGFLLPACEAGRATISYLLRLWPPSSESFFDLTSEMHPH